MSSRSIGYLISAIIFCSVVYVGLRASHPNPPLLSIPTATPTVASSTPPPHTPTRCESKNGLPDPICTPGVTDPRVTENNLEETICKKGYTATIRPPVEYTNKLKLAQMEAYGYAGQDPHGYEEDHLISLELGGAPADPKNLWPELGASPNAKDKVENRCHEKVCNHELSLAAAQQEIATNWPTACQ